MQEPVTAGFPLSPQQKQLWSSQSDGQMGTASVAFLLEGRLDVERLKKALTKIVERHEILRTSFRRSSGMKYPFQVVNPGADIRWEEVDLRPLEAPTEKSRIEEIFAQHTFIDVTQTAVLHAFLAHLSTDRNFLIIAVPSLCADGRSLK